MLDPIEPPREDRQPLLLQQEFLLPAAPTRGRPPHATAHGICKPALSLMAKRVWDLELTPGFTSYPTSSWSKAYDVTALLFEGSNRWEVVVSDGWYRGQLGMRRRTDGYGKHQQDSLLARNRRASLVLLRLLLPGARGSCSAATPIVARDPKTTP